MPKRALGLLVAPLDPVLRIKDDDAVGQGAPGLAVSDHQACQALTFLCVAPLAAMKEGKRIVPDAACARHGARIGPAQPVKQAIAGFDMIAEQDQQPAGKYRPSRVGTEYQTHDPCRQRQPGNGDDRSNQNVVQVN